METFCFVPVSGTGNERMQMSCCEKDDGSCVSGLKSMNKNIREYDRPKW